MIWQGNIHPRTDTGNCHQKHGGTSDVSVVFYDDVGKLVAFGVVDERLVIGSHGLNIVSMWDALAPYIYRERVLSTPAMLYFEDLAARAKTRPMATVHAQLGLSQCLPP
ncbi:DUF4760 domain-containing protein [Streptomyces sp. 2A115]|uniref:DUF4760 domain-containing protein n=1 Tax=Streptomyces sp. 2A115 TaxID=3457439 RepID=UPI003FD1099E